MPDNPAGNEILTISDDFPPVATGRWEEVIRKDLRGTDYEKKLVWRTDEGIAVRPYYRAEDLAGLGAQLETEPGQPPFVRGTGKPWATVQEYVPPADAVRGDELHERGANAVQELGFALAAGVERLAALCDSQPVDAAAQKVEFVFAVGPAYFIEIAKFRAARMLWSQAVAAFGAKPVPMRIAVRTPLRNKSVLDRYTNLLRVTTEALAAAIGGCDTLAVQPFGFDEHLAANVQHIIREEAHIDRVADPAGGSYFIETLTASLARAAWKLFQQVEAEGGYAKAVASGSVEKALAQSRAALAKAVSSRRRTLVGVNNFPNLQESAEDVLAEAPGEFRLALPFERIRQRTARHAQETGRLPEVLLLKRGDVKMRTARANFSLNFFGCAGFQISESEEYEGTQADLIVLCSSDAEYLAFAQEVCPKVSVPVIVAGNPKEQIDALKAAGVQGFIHIQSDAVQTLTDWQDRLGVRQ
jgi:methylmalonyl-CoA mutase